MNLECFFLDNFTGVTATRDINQSEGAIHTTCSSIFSRSPPTALATCQMVVWVSSPDEHSGAKDNTEAKKRRGTHIRSQNQNCQQSDVNQTDDDIVHGEIIDKYIMRHRRIPRFGHRLVGMM